MRFVLQTQYAPLDQTGYQRAVCISIHACITCVTAHAYSIFVHSLSMTEGPDYALNAPLIMLNSQVSSRY